MDPKEMLRNLHAFLKAIYFLHWSNHWKAKGDPSYGDHLLFERLYGGLPAEIDGLAEKMVAMFGPEVVRPSDLALVEQSIQQQLEQIPDPLARALWAEEELQRTIRETFDALEASEQLPLGLNDFLAALANAHDTHVYLLRQRSLPQGELAARVAARAMRKAGITDAGTLHQLIEMEAESSSDGVYVRGDVEITPEVRRAAGDWDKAVERALRSWTKKNLSKLRPKKSQSPYVEDVVEDAVGDMMTRDGGAGFLYFMEAEGHGVGTWEGSWDDLFLDPKKTIDELSKFIRGATKRQYTALESALMAAGDKAVELQAVENQG